MLARRRGSRKAAKALELMFSFDEFVEEAKVKVPDVKDELGRPLFSIERTLRIR